MKLYSLFIQFNHLYFSFENNNEQANLSKKYLLFYTDADISGKSLRADLILSSGYG